ncbi:MAG: dTDP-4-dehydrorhamnose reductase [Rectinemataceae bacterium]
MIWLVGNKGMLGTELSLLLEKEGLPHVGSDRDVDILDPAALAGFAAGKGLTWIVNCAAYTAVDKAEDELELARALNAAGPENLGRLAASIGARIIHISTDYVFDGSGTRPYLESDPVMPLGAYGLTKAEGEARLMAVCPEALIVRTAWLYGAHGSNFVHSMIRLMRQREELGVVADQWGSPTWAADLARALVSIIRASGTSRGIFHFTNAGTTTWYEFAAEIEKLGREFGVIETPCRVKAIGTADYPTKTRRPAYSVLSKEKIEKTFGVRPTEWRESLRTFADSSFRHLYDARN